VRRNDEHEAVSGAHRHRGGGRRRYTRRPRAGAACASAAGRSASAFFDFHAANGAAPVADPEAAQQAALAAAEDLTIVRVIAGLHLTRAQMERLLPQLDAAQVKLTAQEAEARAALEKPLPLLEETRRALIAGSDPSTRAEGQIAEQTRVQAGKLRQLRDDLAMSLRRTLNTLLTADQQVLLGQTARTLSVQRRSARFFARGTNGGGDRGPMSWMGRALDQARGASEANYAEERLRIATRLMARGGPRGNRQQGEQGRQAPPSPNDPEVQRQMGPLLAMIDRTRQMPDAEYRQSRDTLAMQIWSQRMQSGDGPWGSDPEAEIRELLDRTFLSPRMIPLMRERMAANR
jgi:hypothetical protein